MHYQELKIRLEPRGDGTYAVAAEGPTGEANGSFGVPFDPIQLENYILKFGRTRRGVRRIESAEMELARTFGTTLFDALFADDVRDLYRDSWRQASNDNQGLRIKLSLARSPGLMEVPWEYLCDGQAFLSISPYTPVVRYLDLPRARAPLAIEPPIRILGMISAPTDAVILDVEREQHDLEAALLGRLGGLVTIEWLEAATLQNLLERLDEREYHVFHFIGHGGYDSRAQESVLLLEDESNRGVPIGGLRLATILADHPTLRLAVLNACEGARTSIDDPFSGVATSLVQNGIPAVVAMQFEISDRAAIVFADKLYSALARGRPIDWALAHARKAIYADHNDIEWGTPVLFMRVPDGRIFDIDAAAVPEPEPVPEPTRDPIAVAVEAVSATAAPARPSEPAQTGNVVLTAVLGGFLLLTAVVMLFGHEFVPPIMGDSGLGKPLAVLEPAAVALAAIAIGLLIDRNRLPVTTAAGALLGLGAVTVASALGAAGSTRVDTGEPLRSRNDALSVGVALISVSVLGTLGALPAAAALLGVGAVTVGSLGATGRFGTYGPYLPDAGPSALFVGGGLVFVSGLAARGAFRRPTRRVRGALTAGAAGVVVATAGVFVPVHVPWVALILLAAGVMLAGLATAIALGGRADAPTHPLSPPALGGAALILVALAGSNTFFNTANVQRTSWTALELATTAAVGLAAIVLARWHADRVFAATMLLAAGTQASLFLLPYILLQGGVAPTLALVGALILAREGWRMLQTAESYDILAALHS